MMEMEQDIDPLINCNVCGESRFQLREGFFYCQECGTKSDQVRDVEVERDDEFNDSKHCKVHTIRAEKLQKPELTSWECYNYILRGLVEELLTMGAKEELKQMALQLWAAYLRRMQVAFFNKNYAELPKLHARYLKRDVKILYNHGMEQRKRQRKRRKTNDTGSICASSSVREWSKHKRKFDKSEYELLSASQTEASISGTSSVTSRHTSNSGCSSRPIQLNFSSQARRQLKRIMPVNHLKKHEQDFNNLLQCHKIKIKAKDQKRTHYDMDDLCIRHVYIILALALNLIEDDIQVSDLLRFIGEGHLSTINISHFFPENVRPHCREILKSIHYFNRDHNPSSEILRRHAAIFCKTVNITTLVMPNIQKLVQRFITELCLPEELAIFVERHINLHPPNMKQRVDVQYKFPCYEARAMAYIIFALKLLFGLDGHKEKEISISAKEINEKLDELFKRNDDTKEYKQQRPLFVWEEWVEYVEMRKIILSQYHKETCRRFKQSQSTAQYLGEICEKYREIADEQEDQPYNKKTKPHEAKVTNLWSIFERFQTNYKKSQTAVVQTVKFSPSFTPCYSYMRNLILSPATKSFKSITIPDFIYVDHSLRNLHPLLNAKKLRQCLANWNYQLKVVKLACTSNRQFVGMFRSVFDEGYTKMWKPEFDIDENEWVSHIPEPRPYDELLFKMNYEKYCPRILRQMRQEQERKKEWEDKRKFQNESAVGDSTAQQLTVNPSNSNANDELLSLHSFDLFSENNMKPLDGLLLNAPRRELELTNLFDGLSDDDDDYELKDADDLTLNNSNDNLTEDNLTTNSESVANRKPTQNLNLITSNMDFWVLLGNMYNLSDVQKKTLKNKFPKSFFWLLETCAQTIEVDWAVVYEQLLIIETLYAYGIKPLNEFRDCIKFNEPNPIKDINVLINNSKDLW